MYELSSIGDKGSGRTTSHSVGDTDDFFGVTLQMEATSVNQEQMLDENPGDKKESKKSLAKKKLRGWVSKGLHDHVRGKGFSGSRGGL